MQRVLMQRALMELERERQAHESTRKAFNNFIQVSVLRGFLAEAQFDDPRMRLMRKALQTVDQHFEGFKANEVDLQIAIQAVARATDALHYQIALHKVQSYLELSQTQKLCALDAIFNAACIV